MLLSCLLVCCVVLAVCLIDFVVVSYCVVFLIAFVFWLTVADLLFCYLCDVFVCCLLLI